MSSSEPSGPGLTALARRLAGAVAVLGATVLLLWVAAPGVVRDAPWSGAPTKPSAAVALALVGLAVALTGAAVRVRRALTVAALLLGLEGVLAVALGRPLLTGSVLFPRDWESATPDGSGQMALGSAIALACIAGSLLVGGSRRRLATTLSAAGFALGYVGVLGHLYGVSDLDSLQTVIQMAPPTAVALLAAATAAAMVDPVLPLPVMLTAPGTAGVLVRRLLPWAVLAPPVLGFAVLSGQRAGWFGAQFGLSLVVGAFTVGTCVATIVGARTAARTDRARELAAGALEVFNAELSERVALAVESAERDRDKLAVLLDATPAGIFETERGGALSYANRRWRQLAGLRQAESAAGEWARLVHPEDRDRVRAGWAQSLGTGEDYQARCRYLRHDGEVVWVDTSARPVRGPSGEVLRWLGSVTDVTDRVLAQRGLAESERRYRSVVTAMAEGVVLQDSSGRVVTANEAAGRLLGVGLEQLVGPASPDPWGRAVREDGSELAGDEHPATVALRHGRAVRDVVLGLHRGDDDDLVWLAVSSEPLFDGDDDVPVAAGAVTTFTDVTAARSATAAFRRGEEQFRAAMAHAPIGMALVELDGSFREVNRALCRFLGYAEGELVGRTFQEITHADDLDADLHNVARLVAGSIDHYTMEKRYLTRSGAIVWALLAVSLARDAQDRPEYFVAQILDITDAREAQELLAHRALHDPLTGLPNRDLLMDHLSHALARSARTAASTAVMFCDLDHFKVVNDTHGHEAGDRLLVAVADRLRSVVRPGDTVARLGGDEFVVVAEGVPDAAAVQALGERVRQALAEPLRLDGVEVRTGASIGVAIATAEDDARSVLREADTAMYRAKALGRDRLELSTGSRGSRRPPDGRRSAQQELDPRPA